MQHRGAKKSPPREPLVWDDARLFLALLRAGSLASAGRALGVDKSTLSRRIARLERALGSRLFVRTREGIRPSFAGERLRAHAERVEAEVRAFSSAGVASGDEVEGLVRVATTEGMAARLVSAGLLDLRREYPGLELEILGGNRPVDLGRGEADVAVRVTPTTDPGLTVRVLGRWPVALFASPRYLSARGFPRALDGLAGHDLLLPSGELARLPEAALLGKAPGARLALRSSSLPALVEAALLGHGLVPLTTAWGQSVEGLIEVLQLDTVAPRPTWLVMARDVAERPAVRVVANRLIEAFRGPLAAPRAA